MTLTTTIRATLSASLSASRDLENPTATPSLTASLSLATGTGAAQADLIFDDTRTIAASSSENLDLAGSLTDALNNTLTFATIKTIMVTADAGNTNDVVLGAAASNTFVGPFGSATDTIAVRPGGVLLLAHPGTGWTVTAATADQFKVANSGAGTGVTYSVVIVGTSV